MHGQLSEQLLTASWLSDFKQRQRASRIASLPDDYHLPLHSQDHDILKRPIDRLVQDVQRQITRPIDILRAYGKVAVKAHDRTNCLTEVMIEEAEQWAVKEVNLSGPLAGIPVSLKDSIIVGGFDTTVGYSRNTQRPYAADGGMVKLLKDAGEMNKCSSNFAIDWRQEQSRS